MKKLLIAGLVIVMMFALAACGGKTVTEEAQTVEAAGELYAEGVGDEVKEYAANIEEKASTLSSDAKSFMEKQVEAVADETKLADEEWVNEAKTILGKIKESSASIIDVKAPEAMSAVHDEFVKAATYFQDMATTLESDTSKIVTEGEDGMKTGLEHLENAAKALTGAAQ